MAKKRSPLPAERIEKSILVLRVLSSVLRSERAVQINIEILRVFVRLRRIMSTREDLMRRLDEMEQRYDAQFKIVFDALRQLMAGATQKQIGFKSS